MPDALLLARILDALPGRVVAIDRTLRFVHANARYLEFVNLEAAQVIGRPAAEVVGPGVTDSVRPFVERCFAGAGAAWEGWVQPPGRAPRHVRQTFVPVPAEDGATAIAVVLTEEVPAPAPLPPREAPAAPIRDPDRSMLRAMLDAVPARAVLVSLDDRFLFVNREFAEFFRCSPEEVIGRHVAEVVGEAAWRTMEPWRPKLLAGQSVRQEGWVTYPGGNRAYIQQQVIPYSVGGEVVASVSMTQDLTALRQREAEVERQAAALSAMEAMNTSVVASSLDCVIVIDEDGLTREFNPAAERTFGWRREEVIGRPIGQFIVPPGLRARHDTGFRRYIAGGEAHVIGRRVELEAQRADGSTFPVEVALTEARLPTRRLFTAHLRDLTESRAAAEQIRAQRDRIHQIEKLSAMGSLLAGVAHELNNPLAILLAQAALLKERAAEPEVKRRAERIEAAAVRSGRIVKSFLAMARQKPPEREPLDLNESVQAALEMTAYGLRSAGVELVRELDPALPPVLADRDLVGQVVANLVINAQQALQEKQGLRRLWVRTGAAEGMVALTVADNGPGIPEALRARVFDPYFTTKAVGVGTGIGLSICRQVVEQHGGRIEIADREGGGAEFRVLLPAGAAAATGTAATADRAGAGRSVLVVDDEIDVGRSLAEVLELLGHRAEVVDSGAAALARLREGRFDLVVADLRMPQMDGMALRRAVAALDPALAQRFAVMTGDSVAGHALLEADGADRAPPVLEKPFDPGEVRALLARLGL